MPMQVKYVSAKSVRKGVSGASALIDSKGLSLVCLHSNDNIFARIGSEASIAPKNNET